MEPYWPYWWGVLGSVLVEVGVLVRAVADNKGDWPEHYKKAPTVITKTLFTFFDGSLPVIFGADGILTCVYLGSSAPIVIDKLAAGALRSVDTGVATGATVGKIETTQRNAGITGEG